MPLIHCILLISNPETPPAVQWPLGEIIATLPTPGAVRQAVRSTSSEPEAWLFWDGNLGIPDPAIIQKIMQLPGDLWHAGLRLGTAGLPRSMNTVTPTWMLNCDPAPDIEATSWRVSLRACLMRSTALRQVDFIRPEFQSLAGAALEWGHRCANQGVITRHIPWLLPEAFPNLQPIELPFEDELRFVHYGYKPFWAKWHLANKMAAAAFTRPWRMGKYWSAWKKVHGEPKTRPVEQSSLFDSENAAYSTERCPVEALPTPSISVILPTRGRYNYIGKCLETLRAQTMHPVQIICVDQNPAAERRPDIYESFADLPMQVIWQDVRGQSIARNAALQAAHGDWLFFADDDSEYPPDAIEQHYRLANATQADASTGLSLPPFAYTVPPEYRDVRLAYNLDTGNALIRRSAVLKAGGFDRHYDFGKGADTDLGTRLYLKGFLLMHNPNATRLHYKAESGGLREYGVWWETRQIANLQPRPVITRTYWIMRYLPKSTWRAAILHSVLFGAAPRHATQQTTKWKFLRYYLVEILRIPITLVQVYKSYRGAKAIFDEGPRLLQ